MTSELDNNFELPTRIPPGLELTRTTPVFTESTVPAGLLAAHKVAAGVWGRLVVHTGELKFTFDDEPNQIHTISSGETMDIPPQRPHHLTIDLPATFVVEFYKTPTTPA